MSKIGHNKGPHLDPGWRWRRHCWAKSRKELLGKAMPVEIIRMRMRRAKELGLAYPQYASILAGSGRDVVGFLFTVDGLHLRLRKTLEMPDPVKQKLQKIKDCELMSFSPSGECPTAYRLELNQVSGATFKSAAPEPDRKLNWPEARAAVRAVLDPLVLPGSAVVMIGSREFEREWAMAGKLAKFIPTQDYFTNV